MTYLNYALSDFNTNKYAFISKHILKAKSCDSEFVLLISQLKALQTFFLSLRRAIEFPTQILMNLRYFLTIFRFFFAF